MREHELKCWPDPFQALSEGAKRCEFRRDDRGFEVGDELLLREWDPKAARHDFQKGDYTGQSLRVRVTHAEHGPGWGIPFGFACLSVVKCWKK